MVFVLYLSEAARRMSVISLRISPRDNVVADDGIQETMVEKTSLQVIHMNRSVILALTITPDSRNFDLDLSRPRDRCVSSRLFLPQMYRQGESTI